MKDFDFDALDRKNLFRNRQCVGGKNQWRSYHIAKILMNKYDLLSESFYSRFHLETEKSVHSVFG